MKVRIDKKQLVLILVYMQSIINKKLPGILEKIKLELTDNTLIFSVSNLNFTSQYFLRSEYFIVLDSSNPMGLLDMRLINPIKGSESDTIELELLENASIASIDGNNFKIPVSVSEKVSNFVTIKSINMNDYDFSINSSELTEAIEKVIPFTCKEKTRYSLQNVLFEISNTSCTGSKLITTDGKRLAIGNFTCQGANLIKNLKLEIPANEVENLLGSLKLAKKQGDDNIIMKLVEDRYLFFLVGQIKGQIKLALDTKFPPYEKVIPDTKNWEKIVVDNKKFKKLVKSAWDFIQVREKGKKA